MKPTIAYVNSVVTLIVIDAAMVCKKNACGRQGIVSASYISIFTGILIIYKVL